MGRLTEWVAHLSLENDTIAAGKIKHSDYYEAYRSCPFFVVVKPLGIGR